MMALLMAMRTSIREMRTLNILDRTGVLAMLPAAWVDLPQVMAMENAELAGDSLRRALVSPNQLFSDFMFADCQD